MRNFSFNWQCYRHGSFIISVIIVSSFFTTRCTIKSEKPIVIIAHTIPSKGVRSFQRDYRWHGAPPGKGPEDLVKKDKQKEVALKELKEVREEVEEKIKNLNKK